MQRLRKYVFGETPQGINPLSELFESVTMYLAEDEDHLAFCSEEVTLLAQAEETFTVAAQESVKISRLLGEDNCESQSFKILDIQTVESRPGDVLSVKICSIIQETAQVVIAFLGKKVILP